MQFTDTCTEAQHLRFTAKWVEEDGFGTWDDGRAVGTYKRKYTVSDESGNQVAADVLIYLQDPDAPYIQMLGCANTSATGSCVDAVEYSQPGEVYRDFGATCHDYVDGNLSHAVEVSGEVVDMKKPKTYLINYNCQDLSGNAATTLTRTVIVRDTAAPVIILNGEAENFVEAGFPYSDAGACYSDMLDGQCCLNITDDAHTPQPCANVNGVGCPPNTMTNGIWKKVTVNGQDSTLASNAFATSLAEDRKTGIVQTHRDMPTPNTNSNRAIGGDHGAELTYVITYYAKDFNGNKATPAMRTIFVRDTLPPVITLHPYNGGVLVKQNLYNVSHNAKYRAAGYRNPASHKIGELPTVSATNLGTDHPDNSPTNNRFNWTDQGNPHMMAETSSVNGWLFAAVASAVAGVALLSFSTKSSNQVMVPV